MRFAKPDRADPVARCLIPLKKVNEKHSEQANDRTFTTRKDSSASIDSSLAGLTGRKEIQHTGGDRAILVPESNPGCVQNMREASLEGLRACPVWTSNDNREFHPHIA